MAVCAPAHKAVGGAEVRLLIMEKDISPERTKRRESVFVFYVCVNAQTNTLNWFSLAAVLKTVR
jgi:hypothetical protein